MEASKILESLKDGEVYRFEVKNNEDGSVSYSFIPVNAQYSGDNAGTE